MISPYQYASNSPIWCRDIDGLEGGVSVNYRIITDPVMTVQSFIGAREKDQYGISDNNKPSFGINESRSGRVVPVEWWYNDQFSMPNGRGVWMWREQDQVKRIDPKGITLLETELVKPVLRKPIPIVPPTITPRKIPIPKKEDKPKIDVSPETKPEPKPKVTQLSLNIEFNGNRSSFKNDPSVQLTPILEILLKDPKSTLSVSPLTAYSRGEDLIDLWGFAGDADTSDELVRMRGETIKKWFTDRGVNSSQISVNTQDSFNKTPAVKGALTQIE
jgi:hypothetical protein